MNRPPVPPIQMVKKEQPVITVEQPKFDISTLKNIYEFETQLPGSGEWIRFRPFTTGQIKKILAFEGETNPLIISEVIKTLLDEVIINEDINIHDFFIRDREYLLMEIRNKTKGNKWETQWECEKCKSQNLLNVDLSKLPTKRIVPETVDYELEILPTLTVYMIHLRVRDEMEIISKIDKSLSDAQKQAELVISMVAGSIDSIVVNKEHIKEMTLEDKKYFIEELPTTVYNAIKEWLEKNEYGTNFNVKVKCHSCGHELTVNTTPENFFF